MDQLAQLAQQVVVLGFQLPEYGAGEVDAREGPDMVTTADVVACEGGAALATAAGTSSGGGNRSAVH